VQQLREAFPEPCRYQYVILDRDRKFDAEVLTFLTAAGLKAKRTSVQAPWQNGLAERWIESCRREILDHIIALNEQHLSRILREYVRYHQFCRRVLRHNLAPFVVDDKEAIQHAEGHGRHAKEIHGSDDLAMILQKGQPFPLRVPAVQDAAQIPGHASLGNGKTELLQFPMDFGSAPIRIFIGQAYDQVSQFLGNSRSTDSRSGAPAPVKTKAGAMPCGDGFWFHNQEDIGPAGPKAPQGGPEQPVAGVQVWPRSLAFEHSDLLAECQDFQGDIGSGPEQSANSNQDGEEELGHELMVLTRHNVTPVGALDVRATR
jgi:hypothetical protein